MDSPKFLNYETRPLKFTERKMLVSALTRIVNFFGNNYQYIGLGGVAFTDFKLFHKELHISDMSSIEGGKFSMEKLLYNCPYPFVKIYKNLSTNALNNMSFDKKTIVWLDYDGVLDNYFFDDITTLFSKLPKGSVYLVTCNRELKDKQTRDSYTVDVFKEKFGNNIPFDLKNSDFSGGNDYKIIHKLLLAQIEKTLKERAVSLNENLSFYQLFNFLYEENRGAKMYTFGGIINDIEWDYTSIDLSEFNFINIDDNIYKIDIPNFTRKEIDLVDSHLINKEQELLTLNIIDNKDLVKYKDSYKYLPQYFDIRL
jgi:hypothetical protein